MLRKRPQGEPTAVLGSYIAGILLRTLSGQASLSHFIKADFRKAVRQLHIVISRPYSGLCSDFRLSIRTIPVCPAHLADESQNAEALPWHYHQGFWPRRGLQTPLNWHKDGFAVGR